MYTAYKYVQFCLSTILYMFDTETEFPVVSLL